MSIYLVYLTPKHVDPESFEYDFLFGFVEELKGNPYHGRMSLLVHEEESFNLNLIRLNEDSITSPDMVCVVHPDLTIEGIFAPSVVRTLVYLGHTLEGGESTLMGSFEVERPEGTYRAFRARLDLEGISRVISGTLRDQLKLISGV